MKKSLSVAVVVAMVSSMFASMAFADDAATTAAPLTAEQKYEALKKAGVLEGDETGANLTGTTNRAMIAKILSKAFKLTEDASAAAVYDDITDISVTWAKGVIGAVTKAKFMDGVDTAKFDPSSNVTMEQLATVAVRAFGLDHTAKYTGTGKVSGWASEYVQAAVNAGLISNKIDFTATALRSDLVYTTYVASQGVDVVKLTADKWEVVDSKNVKVTFSDKTTQTFALPTALEAGKATNVTVVYKDKEFNGSVTLAVVVADASSAFMLNSKVLEVGLSATATAVDASAFKVKDASGNAVAVKSAVIAPYVTDGKKALLTLEKDTTAGALYSVNLGAKTVNFGGRGTDSSKPTIKSIASTTDASNEVNQLQIEFYEPVDISAKNITITEKYNSGNALAVNKVDYNGNTKIRITTADQKANTLYGITIDGIKDFAGNVMDKKEDTFTANAATTDKVKLVSAGGAYANGALAQDTKTVLVQFNQNFDDSKLQASSFSIKEAYGTANIAVASVRTLKKDELYDANFGSKASGDAGSATAGSKFVMLTLSDELKGSTLYKLSMKDLTSRYGNVLDTNPTEVNFTGVGKTESLVLDTGNTKATNNTTISIAFTGKQKLDKASVENVANYAITEAYGNKSKLEVKSAGLDGANKIKLTVAAMSANTLYSMTVSNVKDSYGTAIKTDSNANVTNFSGVLGDKLAFTTPAITLDTTNPNYTVVTANFNKNVGSTASDVAHYSIDNGVGTPLSASKDNNKVKLTVPNLVNGKVYNVTVNGLENEDGIAMDSAGLKTSFQGASSVNDQPSVEGVLAMDNQTFRMYFDRDVTDSKIKGVLWNDNDTSVATANRNKLVAGKVTIAGKDATANANLQTALNGAYVYQDPTNAAALIVRVSNTTKLDSTNSASNGQFTITVDGTLVKSTSSKNIVYLAASPNNADPVILTAAQGINKRTARIYFNQAVDKATISQLVLFPTYDGATKTASGTKILLSNATAVDTSNTVFDVATSADITANSYFVALERAASPTPQVYVTDLSGFVNLKDENTSGNVLEARQMNGSSNEIGVISNIPVTMPDNRTILVYYPEAMDSVTASTYSNYKLVSDTSGTALAGLNVVKVEYKDMKATLTLSGNVPSSNNYYLEISTAVQNALKIKNVGKSATETAVPVRSAFAATTSDSSAKVTVSSATYDAGLGVVKVKLNQAVKGSSYSAADANRDFAVYLNGGSTVFTVVGTPTIDSWTDVNGQVYFQNISIPVSGVNAGSVGTVGFASTNVLVGLNGNKFDSNSKLTFAQ